jgi:uncharacterized protein YhhL (DUF1145 family)
MKPVVALSSFILGLIAIAHLCRIIFGNTVMVDDVMIPMWPSYVVVVVFGTFSVLLWRETQS